MSAGSTPATSERAGALLAVSAVAQHGGVLPATNALEEVQSHRRFAGEPDSDTISAALDLLEEAAADVWRMEVLDAPLGGRR